MERLQTRNDCLSFSYIEIHYLRIKHQKTYDNQLERNGIRVTKISLKQHEYNFFVAFSLRAVAVVVA